MHLLILKPVFKSNELFLSVSVIWFYVQAVLNNISSCYRLGLECNRHRICRHCMLQAYSGMHDPYVYIGIISCKKNNSD